MQNLLGQQARQGDAAATGDTFSRTYTPASPVVVQVIPDGAESAVIANGRTVGVYDTVRSLIFSRDGRHYAFVGITRDFGGKTSAAVVRDARVVATFDAVLELSFREGDRLLVDALVGTTWVMRVV
jgi:hypothetical protein